MIKYQLTVNEWLRVLDLGDTIYDWDGFRDVFGDTLMSHEEFQHRYTQCTVRLRT